MPNYGGESSGPSDFGGGNYGSGYDRSSLTGESDYNPNRTRRRESPILQQPVLPPPENPMFARARMQAQNDMRYNGWGQNYQTPQMNPVGQTGILPPRQQMMQQQQQQQQQGMMAQLMSQLGGRGQQMGMLGQLFGQMGGVPMGYGGGFGSGGFGGMPGGGGGFGGGGYGGMPMGGGMWGGRQLDGSIPMHEGFRQPQMTPLSYGGQNPSASGKQQMGSFPRGNYTGGGK